MIDGVLSGDPVEEPHHIDAVLRNTVHEDSVWSITHYSWRSLMRRTVALELARFTQQTASVLRLLTSSRTVPRLMESRSDAVIATLSI